MGLLLKTPCGVALQLSLRFAGSWYNLEVRQVLGQMVTGVNNLLRNARYAARRGSSKATAVANVIFAAVALLVVSVSVLATESRLPNTLRDTSSRHASKSCRMVECGGDELAPVQIDESRPTPYIVRPESVIHYSPTPIESPLPELVGVPQAHGFRSPPHI